MSEPKLTPTGAPDVSTPGAILAPLLRFNDARAGRSEDYRLLAILIPQPETGEVLGGLCVRPHVAQPLPRPALRTPRGELPNRVRNSRLKCETSEKPTSSAMSEIRCALV